MHFMYITSCEWIMETQLLSELIAILMTAYSVLLA